MTPIESIDRLSQLLTEKGIDHKVIRTGNPEEFGGRNQIRIYPFEFYPEFFISAISHRGSRGFEEGLIEFWNKEEEPFGYLTPEEAYGLIYKFINISPEEHLELLGKAKPIISPVFRSIRGGKNEQNNN